MRMRKSRIKLLLWKKISILLISVISICSNTLVFAESLPSTHALSSDEVVWVTDTDLQNSIQLSENIAALAFKYGYVLPSIRFEFCEDSNLKDYILNAKDNHEEIGIISTHSKEVCELLVKESIIPYYYDFNDEDSLEDYKQWLNDFFSPTASSIEALGNYIIYPVSIVADEECWEGVLKIVMDYWEEITTDSSSPDTLDTISLETNKPD